MAIKRIIGKDKKDMVSSAEVIKYLMSELKAEKRRTNIIVDFMALIFSIVAIIISIMGWKG